MGRVGLRRWLSQKCLPPKSENLSSDPRTHIEAEHSGMQFNPSRQNDGDLWNLFGSQPSDFQTLVREPVSKTRWAAPDEQHPRLTSGSPHVQQRGEGRKTRRGWSTETMAKE